MNNYFGIGIDAKISLDFHLKREECPQKCRSRTLNYMWYGVLGSKQWVQVIYYFCRLMKLQSSDVIHYLKNSQKSFKNLEQRIQLECDGQRIPLPSLQGIVILNIPRYVQWVAYYLYTWFLFSSATCNTILQFHGRYQFLGWHEKRRHISISKYG